MKLSVSLSVSILLLSAIFFCCLCFLVRIRTEKKEDPDYEKFRMAYLRKTLMSPEIVFGNLFYHRAVPPEEQAQALAREKYAGKTLELLRCMEKGERP